MAQAAGDHRRCFSNGCLLGKLGLKARLRPGTRKQQGFRRTSVAYERDWALSPDTLLTLDVYSENLPSSAPSWPRDRGSRGQESSLVTSEMVCSFVPASQNQRIKALWGPRTGLGKIEGALGPRPTFHFRTLSCSASSLLASSGQDIGSGGTHHSLCLHSFTSHNDRVQTILLTATPGGLEEMLFSLPDWESTELGKQMRDWTSGQ